MQEGERVIRRWFEEFWNKGRVETIDEMMLDGYATRGLDDHHFGKPDRHQAMREFRHKFKTEFSSMKIDVQDVIAQGHRVAARCLVDVTHSATGKKAQFGGMCFVHLKDGKIAEAWNNFDFASMRKQLE